MSANPTTRASGTLRAAFAHFKSTLFRGKLPDVVITTLRQQGAYGYVHGERFQNIADA
jgi:hypothetical protein